MTVQEAKKWVIQAGKELLKSGLIARTWGNISARISDTQFVITPSGRSYEDLTEDEIVVVNIADCSFMGAIKPSSEKGVHAIAYQYRKEVNFIIHTHQIQASVVSILGKNIQHLNSYVEGAEEILGDVIACAKYGMSSTDKITKAVGDCIIKYPSSKAILMKYHGALCMGGDYEEAFRVSKSLEDVSRKYFEILTKGDRPEDEEQEIEDLGSSMRIGDQFMLTIHGKESAYKIEQLPAKAPRAAYIHSAIYYQDKTIHNIEHITTPYIMKMSNTHRDIRPYLDDEAQIIGTCTRWVDSDVAVEVIAQKLKGNNAIFMADKGALCVGADKEDVDAAAVILEKGCQAATLSDYVLGVRPLGRISAYKDRKVYVTSYSKLKQK